MAVTSDDLVNLETALTARGRNPDVPVVMRIFDPKLAERLDRGVELDITRSMSALAAPVFAAALLRRALAQPISLPNVPLRVLETALPEHSPHAGKPISQVQAPGELYVLAADGRWRPPHDLVLAGGNDDQRRRHPFRLRRVAGRIVSAVPPIAVDPRRRRAAHALPCDRQAVGRVGDDGVGAPGVRRRHLRPPPRPRHRAPARAHGDEGPRGLPDAQSADRPERHAVDPHSRPRPAERPHRLGAPLLAVHDPHHPHRAADRQAQAEGDAARVRAAGVERARSASARRPRPRPPAASTCAS